MGRSILVFIFLLSICGKSLNAQIQQSYLKEYAEKEAFNWGMKLELGKYKTQKLSEILLTYKLKEGKVILENAPNFDRLRKDLLVRKNAEIKNIFSSQEFKLYQLFNEYSNIDRIEYLKTILEEYTKNDELIASIVQHREEHVLPVLRVHRGELEMKISKADREALNVLRTELYETLDKCIIDCKKKHSTHTEQHNSLEELLFSEITSQLTDKMSSMNHLLQLASKYEEEIDEERSHFENKSKKWNAHLNSIHEKYILDNHLEAFQKTLESNSVVAWKHVRFNAFFLLLDPSTEEESKKILKLGMIVLPHLSI